MKILFSDNTLWGLLNFRGGVIDRCLSLGYSVVLVAPEDNLSDRLLLPLGVKYIPITLSRTGTNIMADLRYYRALKSIYRSEQPDHIFHYTIKPNIYGTLAAKALNIPSTAVVAGLGHVYTQAGVGNLIARAMYRYALRGVPRVLVLNNANYETLIERKVVKSEQLTLLPGGEGVDLVKFAQLPYPNNEKPIFLMIARVLYEKGYAEYVAAAKALRGEAVFRLMGPVDTHPSAVTRATILADAADGAIEYIEFSPDVQSQVAQADCIILPSYHEGLSRVLIEALAYGRPIVASDIAGCRETVDQGVNGFLVPPKNAQALAETCRRFIALSAAQKQAMAVAGRAKAEAQFGVNSTIEQYVQILDQQ